MSEPHHRLVETKFERSDVFVMPGPYESVSTADETLDELAEYVRSAIPSSAASLSDRRSEPGPDRFNNSD